MAPISLAVQPSTGLIHGYIELSKVMPPMTTSLNPTARKTDPLEAQIHGGASTRSVAFIGRLEPGYPWLILEIGRRGRGLLSNRRCVSVGSSILKSTRIVIVGDVDRLFRKYTRCMAGEVGCTLPCTYYKGCSACIIVASLARSAGSGDSE